MRDANDKSDAPRISANVLPIDAIIIPLTAVLILVALALCTYALRNLMSSFLVHSGGT